MIHKRYLDFITMGKLLDYPKDRNRRKLLEVIVFFAQKKKIKYLSKMMVYKLLAEIDARHFEETGFPITNLQYNAFKWGPVPKEFHNEITKDKATILPEDFGDSLQLEEVKYEKNGEERNYSKFIAKRKPDTRCFTPRELRIMDEVAFIYKEDSPTTASQASHEPNKIWTKTVAKKGEGAKIELIEEVDVKDIPLELIKDRIKEKEAINNNYNI